jgi:uncharacterized protein (UPF0218 family)
MVRWNPELKIGDFLTALSVLVALGGFLYLWVKDRRLRRREYADRIRRAAAETVAGLDRWRQLALSLYDTIQPLITDSDVMVLRGSGEPNNITDVRDFSLAWVSVGAGGIRQSDRQ